MSNEANPRKPILVIGVGGCGINIARYLAGRNLESVDVAVADRDPEALSDSCIEEKILIDGSAESLEGQLESLLAERPDLVFVVGGMGGDTAGEFAPAIGRFVKGRGICTVGIAVNPFAFEGARRNESAALNTRLLNVATDNVFVNSNELAAPDTAVGDAFDHLDASIAQPIEVINDIISGKNIISLDINDVVDVFSSPRAVILEGEAEGDDRVAAALRKATERRDISMAKKLLVNVFVSPQASRPLLSGEMAVLSEYIDTLDPNIEVTWGVGLEESLGDRVRLAMIASGLPD